MADAQGGAPEVTGSSMGAKAMALVDGGHVEAGEDPTPQPQDTVEPLEADSAEPSQSDQAVAQAEEVKALEDFFGEGAQDPKPETSPDDDDEIDFEEAGAPSRAQKRIRALSGRLKETSSQLQHYEQQTQAATQWQQQAWQQMQQQQQAMQQMQVQLAELRAREQAMASLQPQGEEDPVAKFRGEIRSELMDELSPELKRSQEQVQALQKHLEGERRKAQVAARRAAYNREVDQAVDTELKPYLDDETYSSDSHFLGALTLSLASSMGPQASIQDASRELRKRLFRISRGFIRARNAANGAKVAQSQEVPSPSPPGRGGARGGTTEKMPTMAKLRAAGFRDHMKWQMAGSPPL